MIYLIFTHAETKQDKKSVQLVRCLTIGRGVDADIQLVDDETLSRLHTLVVPRQDGRIDIRDLSSTSGTFVVERGNKKQLMPELGQGGSEKGRAILAAGEIFFIGRYRVEVCYEEALGEPTLQPPPLKEEITEIEKIGDPK